MLRQWVKNMNQVGHDSSNRVGQNLKIGHFVIKEGEITTQEELHANAYFQRLFPQPEATESTFQKCLIQ
jgi:hypothetical protein